MDSNSLNVVIPIVATLAGLVIGYLVRSVAGKMQIDSVERRAKERLDSAEKEVQARLKEVDIQGRAEGVRLREEFEKSTKARRQQLQDIETRLTQREENMDRKATVLDAREQAVRKGESELLAANAGLDARSQEVERLAAEARTRLQKLAGMTHEEGRRQLLQSMEAEVRGETGALQRRLLEEARETADREAAKIVSLAIQRYAAAHAGESMTGLVQLPSDDVKGRIIGREGRNIRAFEAATGVTLVIDDTPQAVSVSSFDPVRREIARRALSELVADGRIHPARIEEVVDKVRKDLDGIVREAGNDALYAARVQGVPPELVSALGRLKFRSSYSQNVLSHSVEAANLMGVMASELGLDAALARRIGLFHDIGKSSDHEVEGAHAAIGAELLSRHGENAIVANAVASHHGEVESKSLYGFLCSAADQISGARPGARSESDEYYVQRLEKLESIASGFPGVHKCYAIQAGREIRVVVDPGEVNDNEAMILAREIAGKISAELEFPGQIRVVVLREQRFVEYAR
ncbi:MAG: ribonuclease Y [Kiritimatiellia bacterium]|jgi:ribonuclease Y